MTGAAALPPEGKHRVSRRAALSAVGVLSLLACGPMRTSEKEQEADLRSLDRAVQTASPRVVDVLDRGLEVNGLGHALYCSLRLDSPQAVGVEHLDVIVEALWTASPRDPNAIRLVAFADEDKKKPVDLRDAAAQLSPMLSRPFGPEGVSLIGMWKRYGEWEEPA